MKAIILGGVLLIPLIPDKSGTMVYYRPERRGHSCGVTFPELATTVENTPLESRLWYKEYKEPGEEFELPDSTICEEVLNAILKVKEMKETEEVILTMDQIAEKFNIPVSNLKIKKQ